MRAYGLSLLFVCLAAGCSSKKLPAAPGAELNQASAADLATDLSGQESPFVFEVVDEVNDGSSIHLRVRLETKGVWNPAGVALKFSGLNAGQVVQEEVHPLSALLAKEGISGTQQLPEEALFSLVMPAAGLTDYQIELLWGEEASGLVDSAPPPAAGGGLLIRNLTWQERRDCNQTPCRLSYYLQGEFFNGGVAAVNGVILGVQLRPGGGGSGGAARGEDQVRVDGLNLPPGEGRRLEIEIDGGQSGGQQRLGLEPAIRIVDEW